MAVYTWVGLFPSREVNPSNSPSNRAMRSRSSSMSLLSFHRKANIPTMPANVIQSVDIAII